eukprot:CAMPEP_0201866244 /NCGR_PEP_ID=MMETSP0902-20130614/892_1 /ASSEMBLY_ACC=CAM_ASM_000551 /TAXON_ID=420261 /ORGANISM="Thalassiosira antarctica, Strain CCMP982" /LENGTH=172 /DNA_ID=CAMNT_0048391173 /DNA_START=140 /DNA_END=658 /DNA_ORIENTATION=+
MAAVAPDQSAPMVGEPTTEEERNAPADESEPIDGDEDHLDDDDDEEENEKVDKEWDEGGKSHCGYSDSVHDTLMSIGESINKVVGEPNDGVQNAMKGIGNWFQEASYAARDLQRGKMDVAEETVAAIHSYVSGDEEDKEEDKETEEWEHGEGGEEKLQPVKEDPSVKEAPSS